MTQAGAWLARYSEDFAHSMVLLKRATNVKYGQFVEPGQTLSVTAQILDDTENETELKASGSVNGKMTVSGRLVLSKYNLADTNPDHARIDKATKTELRKTFNLIYQPGEIVSETTTS
jgi:3-hydroxyacyl-[acyl-carrier-protein] dehydratase